MGPNREPYSDNLGEKLSPLVSTKNRLKKAGIIAILRGQNPSKLFDRGIALAKIGCTAIEVSLDSKDALQIIQRLRTELPDTIQIGVGTILERSQIQACSEAGATFALSPTFPEGMIEDCHANDILAIPGVCNLVELHIAQKAGAQIVKLFPSTEWISEELVDVRIPWIPVGSIDNESIWTWLDAGAWCVGMGANLCGSDLSQEEIGTKDWVGNEAQRARDIFMELQHRHNAT